MYLLLLCAEIIIIINTGGQLNEYPAAFKLCMGVGNQSETDRH